MTTQLVLAIIAGYTLTGAFVGGRMCGLPADFDERMASVLAGVFLWPFLLAASLGFPRDPRLPQAKVHK